MRGGITKGGPPPTRQRYSFGGGGDGRGQQPDGALDPVDESSQQPATGILVSVPDTAYNIYEGAQNPCRVVPQ